LAARVRHAAERNQFPLVLAGSCDVSKGVLSGLDRNCWGVVWIDAHADFNTPDTTISGFFPGMSLAVITGHCYQYYWARLGNSAPISEAAVVLLGVRDMDPAERQRLEHSSVQVVEWRHGSPCGNATACLETLAQLAATVYLHVDVDGLDPAIAPGVADRPVPGGLSLQEAEEIIRGLALRVPIGAATLATYNPERDLDDRTLHACLRIIAVLVEAAEPPQVRETAVPAT
jgi:arginase